VHGLARSNLVNALNASAAFQALGVTCVTGAVDSSLVFMVPVAIIDNQWLGDLGIDAWGTQHWGVRVALGDDDDDDDDEREVIAKLGYRGYKTIFGVGAAEGTAFEGVPRDATQPTCGAIVSTDGQPTPTTPGDVVCIPVSLHIGKVPTRATTSRSHDRSAVFSFHEADHHGPRDAFKIMAEASYEPGTEGEILALWIAPSFVFVQHNNKGTASCTASSKEKHWPYHHTVETSSHAEAVQHALMVAVGHRPGLRFRAGLTPRTCVLGVRVCCERH
jgi:hypothetical protein